MPNSTSHYSDNTIISTGSVGIYANGGAPILERNNIKAHSFGIEVRGSSGAQIKFNTIANSDDGILILGSSSPTILSNNLLNYGTYHVRLASDNPTNVDATSNYWGSVTTDEMQAKGANANIVGVYDWYDNPAVGFIDYGGWNLTSLENTPPFPPGTPVHSDVSAPSNTDDDSRLDFTWDTSLDDVALDHYNIYVSEDAGAYTLVTTTTENSITITGEDGKSYRLKVEAVDTAGKVSWPSDQSEALVVNIIPPQITNFAPPSNTHNTSQNTNISATYDQNIDPTFVTTQTFAVHAMQTGQLLEAYSVNSGQVIFDPSTNLKSGELVQVSVTTGIQNEDGVGAESPKVWEFRTAVSNGGASFTDSGQRLGDATSLSSALGDLDGDGDLDAIVVNCCDSPGNSVWVNDGTSVYTNSGQILGNASSRYVALGDLDGDGDLDAFVAVNGAGTPSNSVWINDGTSRFASNGQALGSSDSYAVALGDLDGDGDLDAFVSNFVSQPNKVWVNDGYGQFSDSGQNLGNSSSRHVVLGDVDGDSDLDAYISNHAQNNRIWLNNGSGIFTDSGQTLDNSESHAAVLGDLDGDGDLDAYIANMDVNNSGADNRVEFNNGSGIFSDSGQRLGNNPSSSLAIGDLDGDGDLDIFVGNSSGHDTADVVWLNDGAGSFARRSQEIGDISSQSVALGDIDSDGDLDAFIANPGGANQVWLNGIPLAGLCPFGTFQGE